MTPARPVTASAKLRRHQESGVLKDAWAVLDALPALIAVVEAAERLPKYAGESTEMLRPVHSALATLSERLEAAERDDESDLEAQSERRAYWRERAQAAEARERELREALTVIAENRVPTVYGGGLHAVTTFAAEALRSLDSEAPRRGLHGEGMTAEERRRSTMSPVPRSLDSEGGEG